MKASRVAYFVIMGVCIGLLWGSVLGPALRLSTVQNTLGAVLTVIIIALSRALTPINKD